MLKSKSVYHLLLPVLTAFSSLCWSAVTDGHAFSLIRPLTVEWKSTFSDLSHSSPINFLDTVYQARANGDMFALQADSGRLIWRSEVGGQISIPPIADAGALYVASASAPVHTSSHPNSSAGVVRALGRLSGLTIWVRQTPSPFRGSIELNEKALFGGTADGRLYAFEKETGELIWGPQQLLSPVSQLVLCNNRLIVGLESGFLLWLEQETGRTIWRYRTPTSPAAVAAFPSGIIFFGSTDGKLYAVAESAGGIRRLWHKRAGTGVQTISLSETGLLVTTSDNFVLFFSPKTGKRIWKRQLPGRLAGQPLVTSEGALFALVGEDACIALSLRDGRQINTIPLGEDNEVVAAPALAQQTLLIPTRKGLLAFKESN